MRQEELEKLVETQLEINNSQIRMNNAQIQINDVQSRHLALLTRRINQLEARLKPDLTGIHDSHICSCEQCIEAEKWEKANAVAKG